MIAMLGVALGVVLMPQLAGARAAAEAKIVASVCTGAFLLAASGVVTNDAVTTHWEDIAELRERFPSLDVREGVRWVDNGRIVSSAGISAGIDMPASTCSANLPQPGSGL